MVILFIILFIIISIIIFIIIFIIKSLLVINTSFSSSVIITLPYCQLLVKYIAHLSQYKTEEEVLMLPYCFFEVIDVLESPAYPLFLLRVWVFVVTSKFVNTHVIEFEILVM